MKFKAEKNTLLDAIQRVYTVISVKSALPILANILIEAQHDNVRLTATDLDVGISCVFSVNVAEPGAITIPAKRFSDIIRELPGDQATLTTKKNNLITIETESCQFKIMGIPREEFPKLPEFKDTEALTIDQASLKRMLSLTSFAVSVDETRYILNGILFKIVKNTLVLVATDGKRLAVIDKKLTRSLDKEISIIIPIKTIQELSRNLTEDGELTVLIGNNQVLFDLGNVVIISRLIEGEFPDYRQVIPAESENRIRAHRTQLLLAVKRAALLSTPDYQAVKFEVFKNKILISKSTPDIGESREEMEISYQGKELVIGFNPHYVIDVLKNLDTEEIELEVTDSEKPGVIRSGAYVYIVLPMRLG